MLPLYFYPIVISIVLWTQQVVPKQNALHYWKWKLHLPRLSVQAYALLVLIVYWALYFVIDQFLTPHTTPDWRRVQDYLDIISIAVGMPLVVLLFKLGRKYNDVQHQTISKG